MATTIVTKYGSDAPATTDIVRGELAVDTENGRLYTENAAGAVVEIGLKPEANVDVTGTITASGVVTANAGVVVDNITIDGTTLTSTDDFIVDASSDINLDAGGGQVRLKGSGSTFVTFNVDATPEVLLTGGPSFIGTTTSDAALTIFGSDGGSNVNALVFDMAAAGAATFNSTVTSTKLNVNNTTNTNKQFINSGSTGTGANYININSTGGAYYLGSENSSGNELGATAYDFVMQAPSTRAINLMVGAGRARLTSTGLDVTGTATVDGLTSSGDVTLSGASSPKIRITDTTNTCILDLRANDSDALIRTTSNHPMILNTNQKDRIQIAANGDISFYEDTGTTAKLFWDASAESLGIGTSSLAAKMHVKGAGASSSTNAIFAENSSSAGIFAIRDNGDAFILGNTGIGTSSPSKILHISDTSSSCQIMLTSSNSDTAGIIFGDSDDSATGHILYNHSDDALVFGGYNNTERMRIDASGNVLVGKTAADFSVDGVALQPSGVVGITRDGGVPLILNRKTSDGDIVNFQKSGAVVGSIGTYSSTMQVGQGNVYLKFANATDSISPANGNGTDNDDSLDLGQSGARFDDIYATNGTIQTSDRNEKQDIAELSDAEQRVAVACKGLLRKFRWKSSVAEKGDEARTHFGIIAQDLQAAFAAEGLDAGDYAMFISTTWTDEETNEERTRMGVRYSELLAFIISAI